MRTSNTPKETSKAVSRRGFLNTAGTAAAFTILPRYVMGGSGYTAPSEKLNLAMVGAGGQGMRNILNLLKEKDVHIVALSDTAESADYSSSYHRVPGGRDPGLKTVQEHYAASENTKGHAKCRAYVDFREMLDREADVDAVVVSTPDHTHYVASMDAIARGKHVYVEKPMARTIYEVRKMAEAARQSDVVTQLGHQGHGKDSLRITKEWIQAGAIGTVTEVHAWSDKPNLDSSRPLPTETPPVPRGLDWDLWLGPAEKRPYHPDYTPLGWRYFWDFGTSRVGDMGSHNMDPAFYALDLGQPEWVEARCAWAEKGKRPLTAIVHYNFAKRGEQPPVRLIWYEGSMPIRPDELKPGDDLVGNGNGTLFVGDQGKIMCPGWAGDPSLLPEEREKSFRRPPKTIPRVDGIYRDWIDSIKEGRKASSDWGDYSGPFAESILAGVVAMRTGERCYLDWENLKVTNLPDAESLIVPEYHNGWKLH
jgi:predicted dehydrogenase